MKKRRIEKEQCIIDVYNTEDGETIYKLELSDEKNPEYGNKHGYAPNCCMEGNGYFVDSDALDNFIEENEDELEIVKDYRI